MLFVYIYKDLFQCFETLIISLEIYSWISRNHWIIDFVNCWQNLSSWCIYMLNQTIHHFVNASPLQFQFDKNSSHFNFISFYDIAVPIVCTCLPVNWICLTLLSPTENAKMSLRLSGWRTDDGKTEKRRLPGQYLISYIKVKNESWFTCTQ